MSPSVPADVPSLDSSLNAAGHTMGFLGLSWAVPGMGLHDPCESLPAQSFCDSMEGYGAVPPLLSGLKVKIQNGAGFSAGQELH